MKIIRTVGPKGQLVIPKNIRNQFNMHTGSEIEILVRGEDIILHSNKVDAKKFLAEFSKFKDKMPKLSARQIKKIIEEQYE